MFKASGNFYYIMNVKVCECVSMFAYNINTAEGIGIKFVTRVDNKSGITYSLLFIPLECRYNRRQKL